MITLSIAALYLALAIAIVFGVGLGFTAGFIVGEARTDERWRKATRAEINRAFNDVPAQADEPIARGAEVGA